MVLLKGIMKIFEEGLVVQNVAILDFGSEKITVLIGHRGVNKTICISGKGERPYAGFSDGNWFEPEKLRDVIGQAIADAETNARVKVKQLYIGVPGEFSTSVCNKAAISFNKKKKITDEDLDALHTQGDNFTTTSQDYTLINSQPIYYTLDDERRLVQPVGLSSAKIGGLISYVLAETRFIKLIDNIMKSLSIENFSYHSTLLAETLLLFDDVVRDRYVVLVDVGHITSNVVVARGDGVLAHYNFSLGGGHISGDLANYFNISFAKAEALKRKVGLSLNVGQEDVYEVSMSRAETQKFSALETNEIVKARLNAIAGTIDKCLQLCTYNYPDYIPYHITGGGLSYIQGAPNYISKVLKKQVEVVSPRLPQFDRPHLSSSIGLLDLALNIAPPKKKGFFARLFSK